MTDFKEFEEKELSKEELSDVTGGTLLEGISKSSCKDYLTRTRCQIFSTCKWDNTKNACTSR